MVPIQNTPIRSILIVRLSAIGDVIHVLPCLHALRGAFPGARIGWVVEELSASLLRGHPEIDELFVIPKKRWRAHPVRSVFNGEKLEFYRRLRAGAWDVAIDFQGLTKSGLPAWLSGAPVRIGFAGAECREVNGLFTNRKVVPPDSARHVIERNLSLLEPLGIARGDGACRFPDFAEERRELAPFLKEIGCEEEGRFIALNPGAGWETKRWPPERFAELARILAGGREGEGSAREANALPMVLIWGPGEEELCREILMKAGLSESRLAMAPRTNLRQMAALLERAAVVVGGDTGPIHLAAALGVPVVGIYGGSDPVRNGPWGKGHVVLQSETAPCKCCWKTRCMAERRLECLTSIGAGRVAEAVREMLGQGRGIS